MALRRNDLGIGQTVSIDQYITSTLACLQHTKGKEPSAMQFTGGNLFDNHCSKFVFILNQVSLGAGETLVGKHAFESLLGTFGFSIQSLHGDNDIFTSYAFKEDCKNKGQTISFSGSGAHQQNGIVERSNQTVVNWARTMLLHAALHWTEIADLQLWPYALQNAAYLWNVLPHPQTKLSPWNMYLNLILRIIAIFSVSMYGVVLHLS